MTGFEPVSSGAGSNRSDNSATTPAQQQTFLPSEAVEFGESVMNLCIWFLFCLRIWGRIWGRIRTFLIYFCRIFPGRVAEQIIQGTETGNNELLWPDLAIS